MKKIKIIFASVAVTAALIVGITGPTLAASLKKQITVDYGISLQYNGSEAKLTDANGNEVQPFVYNGTTYVPIRGVSQLFGAGVEYDDTTNTAYVYDDFSEVCAVVNQINRLISSCRFMTEYELSYVIEKSYNSTTDWYKACFNEIGKTNAALDTISKDNENYDLISGDVVVKYQQFIKQFCDVHDLYMSCCSNPTSSYYNNTFLAEEHNNLDTYYDTLSAISTFFSDYCLWRDIGLN